MAEYVVADTVSEAEWDAWARRYRWHMDQVPVLLSTLRELAIPLAAAVYDGVRVDGSAEDSPLPFRVEAIDDADDLWSALVQYAANVAELLGGSSPMVLRRQWATRNDVAGFRSNADPLTARAQALEVCMWLTERLDAISGFPVLLDTEEFLFAKVRALRSRYTAAPTARRARPRGCAICGERAVVASWVTDGGSGVAVEVGRCTVCGQVYRG